VHHFGSHPLYRDRADCENSFDELKNQWGWGGFTTRDLKRSTGGIYSSVWLILLIIAKPSPVAPCCSRRSADRPAMPAAPPSPSLQVMASMRAPAPLSPASPAFSRTSALERWYRILSDALKKFLRGRKLEPPLQLPAGAASYS
jgi:hypothetical protein